MTEPAVIQFHDVSYFYERGTAPAIKDIDLRVHAGEWVWIVGSNGSGKTTLCQLLTGLLPLQEGRLSKGEIRLDGQVQSTSEAARLAEIIGTVGQDPDAQLIQETVEDELAFGPENLRIKPETIMQRIDSALRQVKMEEQRYRRTSELSGGQKQRIAIASVLTMQPRVLVFDDVTASLDLDAANQFLSVLAALHRQGHTIVITSVRMDDRLLRLADRLIVLDQGRIVADGSPSDVLTGERFRLIQAGCDRIEQSQPNPPASSVGAYRSQHPIVSVENLTFRYKQRRKDGMDPTPVLREVSFEVHTGDIVAVLGPNGTGKTTLGKLIAGLLHPDSGKIVFNKNGAASDRFVRPPAGYVFQNPEHQFIADTVIGEYLFGLKLKYGLQPWDAPSAALREEAENELRKYGLYEKKHLHPVQLSAGEKRLLCVAAAMIMEPDVIIMDEPTAGLDYRGTDQLMGWCEDYAKQGKAIILITHDSYVVERFANKRFTL